MTDDELRIEAKTPPLVGDSYECFAGLGAVKKVSSEDSLKKMIFVGTALPFNFILRQAQGDERSRTTQ